MTVLAVVDIMRGRGVFRTETEAQILGMPSVPESDVPEQR